MKKLLRKLLFGDIPVSEYKTVTVDDSIQETVYLEIEKRRSDVSSDHWLLCLEPVVFGVWLTNNSDIELLKRSASCKLNFTDHAKKTVAVTDLALTGSIEEPTGILFLLTLKNCKISHINPFKTRLLYQRFYKKPQQPFIKLKAYAAAYSYPRKVRVVSFQDDNHFNIFPMDLVGDISKNGRFVFGLRHTNVTLSHIIETKKILISEVPFSYRDAIYDLGKHHSGSPLSITSLPFGFITSKTFGFPVPEWANSYKEIQILKTVDLGSHMLLWGEIVHEENISTSTGHLFHIHFLHYLHQKNNHSEYPRV